MPTEISLSVNNLGSFDEDAEALRQAGLDKPPFVEILWDNYCHLEPDALARWLERFSSRVSLHVMWSQFLEHDDAALDGLLARLAAHVRALDPIAVSDHLCKFRSRDGLRLLIPHELDYDQVDHACRRIDRYQRALGRRLLLENHASTSQPAERQIEFLDRIMHKTGAGLLFDVSNAVVGELNALGPVSLWHALASREPVRCHVGGYAHNQGSGLFHDSHNRDISPETARALSELAGIADITSVTYERDYERSAEILASDLRRIRTTLDSPAEIAA